LECTLRPRGRPIKVEENEKKQACPLFWPENPFIRGDYFVHFLLFLLGYLVYSLNVREVGNHIDLFPWTLRKKATVELNESQFSSLTKG